MSRRFGRFAPVVCLGLLAAPTAPARAQPAADAQTKHFLRLLDEPIATAKFVTPMSLKDALEQFQDMLAMRGQELSILVNVRGFRAQGVDAPFDTQVSLPPVPRKMPLGLALRRMMDELPTTAGLVVRQGHLEIVPVEPGPGEPLRQPVLAAFERRPLREALQELSGQTGVTVNLDSREEEKGKAPVTATFRGNVGLHEAATVLADMAGLRAVVLESSLYVTNPANAARLKKEYAPPEPGRGTAPLAGAVAVEAAGEESPPAVRAKPDPAGKAAAEVVFADVVLSTYLYNEALADEKYTGRRVRVRGTVEQIRQGRGGHEKYVLRMTPTWTMGAVTPLPKVPPPLVFEFAPEDRKALATLAPGRQATVEGGCVGWVAAEAGKQAVRFREAKVIQGDPAE